jgi:hypothetical protein
VKNFNFGDLANPRYTVKFMYLRYIYIYIYILKCSYYCSPPREKTESIGSLRDRIEAIDKPTIPNKVNNFREKGVSRYIYA